MAGGADLTAGHAPIAPSPHWLMGCDPAPGIVSVHADETGRARVWQRVGGRVELSEHRFPNWFLTNDPDLLDHLPVRLLAAEQLRAAHGQVPAADDLTAVELEHGDNEAYRWLVLTDRLADVELAILETYNNRSGAHAETLADLRGLVLVWPPAEQFLLLSGRTYFKDTDFADVHRFQFDLETSGLDEERDRIFMISMRDSRDWQVTLDTRQMSEAALIEHLVLAIRERDPDVLENHNIFAFDLPFLVRRAASLGVRLSLGRDGSEPTSVGDVFDVGDRTEPFQRWEVTGREVIDTQHAVRRFGTGAPDMRRHGLKEAARYFGFARADREYVPGAEIWATFRTDPERVRRYAAADVEEVDGLSRRLLDIPFSLAKRVPRPYERIASDSSALALWEPLMVRAYLHEAHAIPAVVGRVQRSGSVGPRAELHARGVFTNAVKMVLPRLLPSILLDARLRPAADALGAMPALVTRLLGQADEQRTLADVSAAPATAARHVLAAAGLERLAAAAPGYLGGHGLFSDPRAALRAGECLHEILEGVRGELRRHGATVIGADGDQVLLAAPDTWTAATEHEVAVAARAWLPTNVRVVYTDRYRAVYARAPRSYITLGHDGTVTLDGPTFRPGRMEPFGEAFLRQAAPLVLGGDAIGLRRLFLDTVARLRAHLVPPGELCVQVALHRTPSEYRRLHAPEEPYEVLLDAGVRTWRVGQRVRYFRGHLGRPRILEEGVDTPPHEVDVEYYLQRLASLYCQQLAQAFRREDFTRIFRLPSPHDDLDEDSLAAIHPLGSLSS